MQTLPEKIAHLGYGRFTVLEPLGSPGTEAVALLCRDSLLKRDVVCRVAVSDDACDAFRMQFELLVAISSEALVKPLGLFLDVDSNRPFIELEHIAGPALSEWSASASLTDRLRAFSTIATTIAALHDAHVVHGDVHSGNVLVEARRVVLIDPDAAAWGSVMRRTRNPSERSIDTDRRGVVGIFESIFEIEERALRLRPLVNVVNAGSSVGVIADAVRQLLARADLEPVDWSKVQAIGSWQGKSIKSRREQFVKFAHARAIAFDVLHQYVARTVQEAIAGGADFTLDGLVDSQVYLDQELATAGTPKSSLKERRFRITAPEGDQWYVIMNQYPEFKRPRPSIEGKSRMVADIAQSQLHVEGESRVVEGLDLIFSPTGDGTIAFVRFDGVAWKPVDAEWIARCLRILSGAILPVLQRPESIAGAKKSKSSWPVTDVEYGAEDAPHMRHTDAAVDWLIYEIHRWLMSQRQVSLNSHTRVRIFDALELSDNKAIVFLREVYREFVLNFGAYLTGVEAFDVVLSPETHDLTVNVRMTIHEFGPENVIYSVKDGRA